MKVILENFGPIRRVEFDLSKDLNVIFGKNNIGKSYAITALYILLKHLLAEFGGRPAKYLQPLFYSKTAYSTYASDNDSVEAIAPLSESPVIVETEDISSAEKFLSVVQSNLELKATSHDIKTPLTNLLWELFLPFETLVVTSFSNSFPPIDLLSAGKRGKTLRMSIISEDFTLHFQNRENQFALTKLQMHGAFVAVKGETPHSNKTIGDKRNRTVLHFRMGQNSEDKTRNLNMVNGAARQMLNNLQAEVLGITEKVYFLPASRSGLYQGLSNIGSLLAELSKSRSTSDRGLSLPNISEPVADYFLNISTIKRTDVLSPITGDTTRLENDILGGSISFNAQDKKLYYRPQNIGRDIDVSFTSSMVSEIAPIVAYCKYILEGRFIVYGRGKKRGAVSASYLSLYPSLIFIEEPEAHLHPEVQVKLMEFFARLSKHNVKVIMTSHSNYMFNKLSNLLLTNELEPEKVGSYLMRATPEGSVMDPAAMRAEEEGIADENFVDVAEQLYNERLQAYDKLGH